MLSSINAINGFEPGKIIHIKRELVFNEQTTVVYENLVKKKVKSIKHKWQNWTPSIRKT